ncbi:hypothetical protein [Floridanema aerugineum]|uniref:Uncharacterized protein n=1 Tax=Floridaenema aerugineum BLCC-F46 TaxID=3153654 RepID=A0ABV4X575_9CYAN
MENDKISLTSKQIGSEAIAPHPQAFQGCAIALLSLTSRQSLVLYIL